MARDHNLFISSNGDERNAFGYGRAYTNKNTLSRQSGGRNDSQAITQSNLRNIFNIGLGFNTAQKLNETIGAYTNNKLRQRKVDVGMTFGKYAIGLAINPVAGAVYAAADLGYRSLQYNIKAQKINRKADYFRRLSSNTTNSGSAYMGDYL